MTMQWCMHYVPPKGSVSRVSTLISSTLLLRDWAFPMINEGRGILVSRYFLKRSLRPPRLPRYTFPFVKSVSHQLYTTNVIMQQEEHLGYNTIAIQQPHLKKTTSTTPATEKKRRWWLGY